MLNGQSYITCLSKYYSGAPSDTGCVVSVRYAGVGLVVVVPELYALVLVLWHTSFIKQTTTHQWPSPTAIFVVCALHPSHSSVTKIERFSLSREIHK